MRYLVSLIDCEGMPHLGKTSLWNYCMKFTHVIEKDKEPLNVHHMSFMTCSKDQHYDHVKKLIRMNNRFLDSMLKTYKCDKILMVGWNVLHDKRVFTYYGFSHKYVEFVDLLKWTKKELPGLSNYKLANVARHLKFDLNSSDLHSAMYDVEVLHMILSRVGLKVGTLEIKPDVVDTDDTEDTDAADDADAVCEKLDALSLKNK